MIYSGLRPFQCDECDKSFTVITLLKVHMKTYSGTIKQFRYEHGGKTFSTVGNLQTYLRIYSGGKPFA